MSLLLAALLAQAADPLSAGSAALKKTIVDAIRNCPVSTETTIGVCARDRGWAEGQGKRLQKLKKPVVPSSGPAITVTVGDGTPGPDGCTDPRGCRRETDEDRIDAATRRRLTGRPE